MGTDPIPFDLRRRRGARHLRLALDSHNRVVVSAPWRCSRPVAERFVAANRAWIEAELARVGPVRHLLDYLRHNPGLADGDGILPCRFAEGPFKRFRVRKGERDIAIEMPNHAAAGEIRKAFLGFARESLGQRTATLALRHGLAFSRVTVRDQASRWGSCSHAGNISLNWRLLLLSPECRDYVVLHELAHLRVANHSRAFYEVLGTMDPERGRHERELNVVAPMLLRVHLPALSA